MKIEEVNKQEEFQPIELKITIESEEELCDLWHRFNASEVVIDKNITKGVVKYGAKCTFVLWAVIDNIVKSRGLKTNK